MKQHRSITTLYAAICISAAVFVAAATPAGALPSYSGSLSSSSVPAGVTGTGFWITGGTTQIQWAVSQLADLSWSYSYILTVPDGNISHLILELSPSAVLGDLSNLSGTFSNPVVNTFTPSDQSNPNLPGNIYGVKFQNVGTTSGTFSFTTARAPVWGNFYAADGQAHNPGTTNTAWNSGFLLAHPTDPPSNGSVTNHLLVPDSKTAIPDASTIVLACFGALPLFAKRMRVFR